MSFRAANVELRSDVSEEEREAEQVTYTIGLIPNPVLAARAAPLVAAAQTQSAAQGGAKVRLADETPYQAGSWARPAQAAGCSTAGRPAAWRRAPTWSVLSQLKVGSSRPKWPWRAVCL